MSLLDFFVFAHVAGAICWVGSNTILQLLGKRLLDRGNGGETQNFVGDLVYLTPRWFIPISLWTVAFGIATTIDANLSFGDFWISAGMTMFIVSFLIGLLFLGPQSERVKKIGDEQGPETSAYGEAVAKFLLGSRIELGLLWLTVFVMVVKPG